MSSKRSELYSVMKRSEGGPGQVVTLSKLKHAGIKAERHHSPYVGQSGVLVYGNGRIQCRAIRVIFGIY